MIIAGRTMIAGTMIAGTMIAGATKIAGRTIAGTITGVMIIEREATTTNESEAKTGLLRHHHLTAQPQCRHRLIPTAKITRPPSHRQLLPSTTFQKIRTASSKWFASMY